MRVIPRTEWRARYPDAYKGYSASLPAERVWLHHSVTVAPDLRPPFDDDDAAVRALEEIGQRRFGWGISYSFAVTPAGRIYQGHRIDGVGAHTAGQNSTSRAICLVGDYSRTAPTAAQLDAIAWLLREGAARGWWRSPRLSGGHRDVKSTACPGDAAYALIGEINRRAAGPRTEEDDLMELPSKLPDHYAPGLPDQPTAALLAWGVAHAAHARDRATEARDAARKAADAVAALDPETLAARVVDAVCAELLHRLGVEREG